MGQVFLLIIERKFNSEDINEELEKLFEVITLIKQRDYHFDYMRIDYQLNKKEKNVTFILDFNQLISLK